MDIIAAVKKLAATLPADTVISDNATDWHPDELLSSLRAARDEAGDDWQDGDYVVCDGAVYEVRDGYVDSIATYCAKDES